MTTWYYIKTNYVGIPEWEIPKDYDVKQGLIVSKTHFLSNPETQANSSTVELCQSTHLQPMLDANQSLNPDVPPPTRITLSCRQHPNLDISGCNNSPLHRRPLRRHLSMPPNLLQLGLDNQRRKMH